MFVFGVIQPGQEEAAAAGHAPATLAVGTNSHPEPPCSICRRPRPPAPAWWGEATAIVLPLGGALTRRQCTRKEV